MAALFLFGFAAPLHADSADEKRPLQALAAADVLDLAEDVGRWLTATAISGPRGISWPDDALNSELVGYDLAAGVAGKVLYFVALYRATGNSGYLDIALGGADYLVAAIDDPGTFDGNSRRASLYSGISGVGVALLHVRHHDPKYEQALARIVDRLQDWGAESVAGLRWSDDFNDLIYGDAGTALFLAYVGEQTNNEAALAMSQQGARFLLGQAQETETGLFWYFRRRKPFNLPNFSHGTAGVAYVLATIGSLVNDEELLVGAGQGFDYIQSIAEVDGGLLRIPYGWGSETWQGLYEFGWAHGLAGSVSLFKRLQKSGIDADSAAELENLSKQTLLNIGLPATPTAPFAEPSTPLDRRFGRACVLALLSQWGLNESRGADIANLRDAILLHIAGAAVRDNKGAHWEVDAPEFMGGGRAAYTGLFHGAAGIGLAVLQLHATMMEQQPYIRLPDDPFAWPK